MLNAPSPRACKSNPANASLSIRRYYLETQKAHAAKRGEVDEMLWVDHESYFGPDRRRRAAGMRLRERRRYDYAGGAPTLPTAMRQLRMRIFDAHGPGAERFAERARHVAMLARMKGETAAASALASLASAAARGRQHDVRQSLYRALDQAHALLRSA